MRPRTAIMVAESIFTRLDHAGSKAKREEEGKGFHGFFERDKAWML